LQLSYKLFNKES